MLIFRSDNPDDIATELCTLCPSPRLTLSSYVLLFADLLEINLSHFVFDFFPHHKIILMFNYIRKIIVVIIVVKKLR